MELLSLPSFPYIPGALLILLFSILFLQKKVAHSKSNLPPGPWTLPVIGSLHHLATAKLLHRALHNLAQVYGPVMHLRTGEIDLVVITSREAAKEVMKTHDANFANRPPINAANILGYGSNGVIFTNGPHWRQLRRICSMELFTSRREKSFSLIRQREINLILKRINSQPENSPVNVTAMACELSNNITVGAAFGGKCKYRAMFLESLSDVLELFAGFNLSDLFPSLSWLDVNTKRRLLKLRRKLDFVLEEVVQEHLKQPRKEGDEEYDLIDALINVMENGDLEKPITTDIIKSVISDLFVAGTESSSITINWAMAELIKNPKVMAKVQAELRQNHKKHGKLKYNELRYLQQVVKEALRMHPPAPMVAPRLCKESCEVLGYTIPANAKVVINAWSLGRNPEYWNDPEEFKPERFDTCDTDFKGQHFEFLPFGAGRRMCPGMDYGMAVMEEVLAGLLLHFDWRLPDGITPEDVDMTETFGLGSSKRELVLLIPTLRVPLPAAV